MVLESPLQNDHDINALILVSSLPSEETESSSDEEDEVEQSQEEETQEEETQEEQTPTHVNNYWIKDTTSEYPSENVYWHLQTRPIYPMGLIVYDIVRRNEKPYHTYLGIYKLRLYK